MFRRFFGRIGDGFRRFMYGRHGSDQLNLFLTVLAVVLSIAGTILSAIGTSGATQQPDGTVTGGSPVCAIISLVLMGLSYAVLIYVIFRALSKKLDKRNEENRRFMAKTVAFRDREHKYYRCPDCRQSVRVPRNRGKIRIRCPRCGKEFVKKT